MDAVVPAESNCPRTVKLQFVPRYTPPPMFQIALAASVAFVRMWSRPPVPMSFDGTALPKITFFAASWNDPVNSDASLTRTFSLLPPPAVVLNVPEPNIFAKVSVAPLEPLFQLSATVLPLSTSSTGTSYVLLGVRCPVTPLNLTKDREWPQVVKSRYAAV